MTEGRGKKGFLFVRGTARRVEDPTPVAVVRYGARRTPSRQGKRLLPTVRGGGAACAAQVRVVGVPAVSRVGARRTLR